MTAALIQWLLDIGERGAEIRSDGDGRLHYRLTDALAADGTLARLREHADDLRDYYARVPHATGPYRLGAASAAIYVQARLAPTSISHVLRYPVRVAGDVDRAELARALQSLASRHPMLCTRVRFDGVEPCLFFDAEPSIALDEDRVDLTVPGVAQRWIERHSTRAIDLERGPACRFHLARDTGDAALLLLVAHHAVVDFLSLDVLWRDLDRLYGGQRSGLPAPLPAPTFGLSDLVTLPRWQAGRPAASRQREAWSAVLAALPPPVALPGERRGARSSGWGFAFFRRVGHAVCDALERLASETRTTPFVVTFALHAQQFLRCSGAPALCLGVSTSGRSGHPEPDLVGCYVNTVPVVVDGAIAESSPAEAVRQVERPLREAVSADLVPFAELVRLAPGQRRPDRPLLFRTLFTWLDGSRRERAAAGSLGIAPYETDGLSRIGVTHDVVLAVHRHATYMSLNWSFDAAVYDARTVLRLADEFDRMLQSLVATRAADVPAAMRERFEL